MALSLVLLGLGLAACSKKEASGAGSKRGLNIVTVLPDLFDGQKSQEIWMMSGWFSQAQGFMNLSQSASDVAAIYEADVFVYHSRTLES